MNTVNPMFQENTQSWKDVVSEIGKQLDTHAQQTDNSGEFAYQNYELLHKLGLFRMMIPVELGGGGASYSELVEVIREIGQHCGSTALSFSMHSHPIAVNIFKHLRGDKQATATLRKIAHNDLIIAGTGANDWLASSGDMTSVEGGYRVNAHKHFVSGAPGAQVFVTSANLKSNVGIEVLHFAIPFNSEGIKIHDNWNTHGMRATGSNDVTLDNVFVPNSAIIVRRPSGEWHPMWNVILPTAMPLIISAYVGLADAAVDIARSTVAKRPDELAALSGEMLNQHTSAVIALEDMVRLNDEHGFTPTQELASAILQRKTLVAKAAMKTVELAAEIVGGGGFFKNHPIERIQRDIKACHFHPLPYRRQHLFSGRIDIGIDPVHG